MKRLTVNVSDELEESLEHYLQDQEVAPSLTAVLRAALKEYLAERGYLMRRASAFKITPASASEGSGLTDISQSHDQYFSEAVR
ncbi:MAG: hypothetical protein O7F17_02990 [Planctomycetota bacterium]|nr:hypothetical protein [Planctomycetota bacterium]